MEKISFSFVQKIFHHPHLTSFGWVFGFFFAPFLMMNVFSSPVSAEAISGELTTKGGGMSHPETELCDWQRDFSFFSGKKMLIKKSRFQSDSLPCGEVFSLLAESSGEKRAERTESSSIQKNLENDLYSLVSGYPIESMIPFISGYDRDIAGLLIGIAKKESDWGKHVPLNQDGADCFNYWGYKGIGSRGIAMGHGCFGSLEEAVSVVGGRLQELVALRASSEPARLTVWKCGASCTGHSPESVEKWISDVNFYFRQIARQ